MGFEPTRAEHIGLAVQRLNHSATSSDDNGCSIRYSLALYTFQNQVYIFYIVYTSYTPTLLLTPSKYSLNTLTTQSLILVIVFVQCDRSNWMNENIWKNRRDFTWILALYESDMGLICQSRTERSLSDRILTFQIVLVTGKHVVCTS